tara:strand:+ start:64 stop:372 length:309 start_codon:yes stop_codon:yes gene_type:complete
MNKNRTIKLIEYLSICLPLSFFVIHSIYLVFIGIILSYYLLSIDSSRYKNPLVSNKYEQKNESISHFNGESLNQEAAKLSLVEKVEELGFIPSEDEHEGNVA